MKKVRNISILFLTSFALSACLKNSASHGYNFDDAKVAQIKPHTTSKEQLLEVLGSPTLQSTYGTPKYYYIASETQAVAFLHPKTTKYRVLEISFNNDKVDSMNNYYETDLRKLKIVAEHTRVKGNEVNAFDQLVGNIGRFSTPKAARQ